jgi:hypothetical protein
MEKLLTIRMAAEASTHSSIWSCINMPPTNGPCRTHRHTPVRGPRDSIRLEPGRLGKQCSGLARALAARARRRCWPCGIPCRRWRLSAGSSGPSDLRPGLRPPHRPLIPRRRILPRRPRAPRRDLAAGAGEKIPSRRPVPRLPGRLPLGRSQGTRRPLHSARRKLPSTWLARVVESAWAQRSTVPHGEGAAHRIHAGFRGDPRRGNMCP